MPTEKALHRPAKAECVGRQLNWVLPWHGEIAQGMAGLRLEGVTIGQHRHGGREHRLIYTDHFPLTVRLRAAGD